MTKQLGFAQVADPLLQQTVLIELIIPIHFLANYRSVYALCVGQLVQLTVLIEPIKPIRFLESSRYLSAQHAEQQRLLIALTELINLIRSPAKTPLRFVQREVK